MEAPVTPVVVRAKSSNGEVISTPVTDLENTTLKLTTFAAVGLGLRRVTEETPKLFGRSAFAVNAYAIPPKPQPSPEK